MPRDCHDRFRLAYLTQGGATESPLPQGRAIAYGLWPSPVGSSLPGGRVCSRGAAEIAKIRVGATGRAPVLWTNRIDGANHGETGDLPVALQNSRISASSAAPRANATANDVKCDSPAHKGRGDPVGRPCVEAHLCASPNSPTRGEGTCRTAVRRYGFLSIS